MIAIANGDITIAADYRLEPYTRWRDCTVRVADGAVVTVSNDASILNSRIDKEGGPENWLVGDGEVGNCYIRKAS